MDESDADETDADGPVRIDKWLWAARFFKTRSVAATAIAGGKVDLNGVRAKRSKVVHVGDRISVRKEPYLFELTVRGLSHHRGPAPEAQRLYEESEASVEARKVIAEERALERAAALPPVKIPVKGRPTKRDRRALARFKGEPDLR
jgi:ribosome-associated heat shock protein Hsp15